MIKYRDELRSLLKKIYKPDQKWGDLQTQSYDILKQLVKVHQIDYLNSNAESDKYQILTNLKGQLWYQQNYKQINVILSDLMARMKIKKAEHLIQPETKLLILEIDFGNFELNVNYFQQINQILSLLIYLTKKPDDGIQREQFVVNGVTINPSKLNLQSKDERNKKRLGAHLTKKNYLAYNVTSSLAKIPKEILEKMNIPELDDLNEVLDVNPEIISPDLLMKFFLEIILYYDSTETIGNLKLSPHSQLTILQFLGGERPLPPYPPSH